MALRLGCSVACEKKANIRRRAKVCEKMGKLVRYHSTDADEYTESILRMDSTAMVTAVRLK